jgi:hypothetical protein
MTKNPRDERVWTNIEVQEDSAGYLAAQQRRREDAEAEVAKRREENDKARFTEEFVAAGGDRDEAVRAWKAVRNEQATAAARQAEQAAELAAREQTRLQIRRVL